MTALKGNPMQTPQQALELAEALFNHRKRDETLPKTLEALGWVKVYENPLSGAIRVRRGLLEVFVIFGGPHLDACALWWRHLYDSVCQPF